jgi:hypothetical protein
MNDLLGPFDNTSNHSGYDLDNGPSLRTRLVFAGAWILIAVAGIIGKATQ